MDKQQPSPRYRVGIDIGGTFTDFVIVDTVSRTIRLEKTATTPQNLWQGIETGFQQLHLPLAEIAQVAHGTTVGLNTLLERRGDPTGLITTAGFRDAYEIGRGARPDAYNLFFRKPVPLVPREHRLEVRERIGADGAVVTPLNEADVAAAVEHFRRHAIHSIAICFLHAYRNPAHEIRAAEIVAELYPEALISTSSSLVREWREYERISTTCINAYIMPRTSRYIEHVTAALAAGGYRRPFFVNQSSGGVLSVEAAKTKPVTTLMSGPAGGVVAAAHAGQMEGFENIISFDMGGTSTDVCVIYEGQPRITVDAVIDRHPVMVPMIAVHSIGAGGGSIATLDAVGALNVGPHSAGAEPGPVCYGRGGTQPTVTDANLVLGRMAPPAFLPNHLQPDTQAARAAIQRRIGQPLALDTVEAAAGIIAIVNVKMSMAVRSITVQRGLDPKDFVLCAFGGAGPMHACWIARELHIPRVMVPLAPGQFSALGILLSNIRHDFVRTVSADPASFSPAFLTQRFAAIEAEARAVLDAEGVAAADMTFVRSLDARYVGQEYTVNVPVPAGAFSTAVIQAIQESFHTSHQRIYGHASPDEPIELVNLRMAAVGSLPTVELPAVAAGEPNPPREALAGETQTCFAADDGYVRCPVWERQKLRAGNQIAGPAIIADPGATTVLPPGFTCTVSVHGHLLIDVPALEVSQ